MEFDAEIVVVGGGIAGLSLAGALARDGRRVAVLESSLEYEDRVRGESMSPWGVVEAKQLGVLPALLEAGARVTETWVHYDGLVPTELSLANRIPVGMVLPDVPGSLNLRHLEACGALAQAATDAGVQLLRGVSEVAVKAGAQPRCPPVTLLAGVSSSSRSWWLVPMDATPRYAARPVSSCNTTTPPT